MPISFLYSTSPSPHESRIVSLAQLRRGHSSGSVRIVALLTADPEPTADGLEMLRQHFCTGSTPAVLVDAELHDRAGAGRPGVVRLLGQADLILIGGLTLNGCRSSWRARLP